MKKPVLKHGQLERKRPLPMICSTDNIVSDHTEIFHELLQHLHPLQWAFDHPSHSPTKAEISHAQKNRRKKGCCTFERIGKDGKKYKYMVPYLHHRHFEKSISEKRKLFCVSGNRGRALIDLDVDAHSPWQVEHVERAKAIVNDVLGLSPDYWVKSPRGANGHLAVRCQRVPVDVVNGVFKRLQPVLQYLLARADCLADIEIKGLCADEADDGSHDWKQYGKLPLSADDFSFEKLKTVLRNKVHINNLSRLVDSVVVDQTILDAMIAKKKALSKPTHVLLTKDVEDQLLAISKRNWLMAMSHRQVRENWNEYIDCRFLVAAVEEPLVKTMVATAINQPHDLRRDRRFWSYAKDLARDGVPEPDHLADFLFMLARPLLFREYFGLADRVERTIEDLTYWVAYKHNGLVSRSMTEVAADVEKIVRRAEKDSSEANKAYNAMMRANDSKYPHRIELLANIIRNRTNTTEEQQHRLVVKCMVKEPVDTPLPATINEKLIAIAKTEKMRLSKGEYPFVRFARRLLNAVWSNQGRANINRETLLGYLGGGKDPTQQLAYKKLLAKHGLIHRDWERYIKRGKASALYRLTDQTMTAFQESFRQSTQAQTA